MCFILRFWFDMFCSGLYKKDQDQGTTVGFDLLRTKPVQLGPHVPQYRFYFQVTYTPF